MAVSAYGSAALIGTAKYFSRADGQKIEIQQPQMMKIYNEGMRGAYMVNHRSIKYWQPVFHFYFDLVVNDAFQLFKAQDHSFLSSCLDFLGFRQSIVDTHYKRYRTQNNIPKNVSRSSIFRRQAHPTKCLLRQFRSFGLLKGAGGDVQKKPAQVPLFLHPKNAVLSSIQTVLLSFMQNQSIERHLGISYKFPIIFEVVLCLAKLIIETKITIDLSQTVTSPQIYKRVT